MDSGRGEDMRRAEARVMDAEALHEGFTEVDLISTPIGSPLALTSEELAMVRTPTGSPLRLTTAPAVTVQMQPGDSSHDGAQQDTEPSSHTAKTDSVVKPVRLLPYRKASQVAADDSEGSGRRGHTEEEAKQEGSEETADGTTQGRVDMVRRQYLSLQQQNDEEWPPERQVDYEESEEEEDTSIPHDGQSLVPTCVAHGTTPAPRDPEAANPHHATLGRATAIRNAAENILSSVFGRRRAQTVAEVATAAPRGRAKAKTSAISVAPPHSNAGVRNASEAHVVVAPDDGAGAATTVTQDSTASGVKETSETARARAGVGDASQADAVVAEERDGDEVTRDNGEDGEVDDTPSSKNSETKKKTKPKKKKKSESEAQIQKEKERAKRHKESQKEKKKKASEPSVHNDPAPTPTNLDPATTASTPRLEATAASTQSTLTPAAASAPATASAPASSASTPRFTSRPIGKQPRNPPRSPPSPQTASRSTGKRLRRSDSLTASDTSAAAETSDSTGWTVPKPKRRLYQPDEFLPKGAESVERIIDVRRVRGKITEVQAVFAKPRKGLPKIDWVPVASVVHMTVFADDIETINQWKASKLPTLAAFLNTAQGKKRKLRAHGADDGEMACGYDAVGIALDLLNLPNPVTKAMIAAYRAAGAKRRKTDPAELAKRGVTWTALRTFILQLGTIDMTIIDQPYFKGDGQGVEALRGLRLPDGIYLITGWSTKAIGHAFAAEVTMNGEGVWIHDKDNLEGVGWLSKWFAKVSYVRRVVPARKG